MVLTDYAGDVHGDIRHLENAAPGQNVQNLVHGDIRHLESVLKTVNRLH